MSIIEENTNWISTWIVNDESYCWQAKNVADDPASLAEFIIESLQDAPVDSGAWYTAQEMTPADYDRVDWAEIAATLTAV